jgi:hypothetical protein
VTNSQPGFGYGYRDTYEKQRSGNANDWGYMGESFYDGAAGGEFGTHINGWSGALLPSRAWRTVRSPAVATAPVARSDNLFSRPLTEKDSI